MQRLCGGRSTPRHDQIILANFPEPRFKRHSTAIVRTFKKIHLRPPRVDVKHLMTLFREKQMSFLNYDEDLICPSTKTSNYVFIVSLLFVTPCCAQLGSSSIPGSLNYKTDVLKSV